MRCILSIALLTILSGPCWAQVPPTYEIVPWCQDDVAAGGYADTGLAGCVALEQRRVRALRKLYPQVPPGIRAECEEFVMSVTDGRGSYAVLNLCIENKMGH